jgi:hypothetical protein
MSDYKIEAATKEEWAIRALNAEERNKELTLQLLATSGQAADALDKLAKAMEAISRASLQLFWCGWAARKISKKLDTVLAELEGKE